MSDATQALLPVTPEDRELVYGLLMPAARSVLQKLALEYIRDGKSDDADAVQQVARHRQAHSLPGDVGTDALRKALRPFANAAKWWKAFDNQHRITTLHQHGDCLEVGHLRAAEAALTPSSSSLFERKRDEIREAEQATPSALSGDAGEGRFQKYLADEGAARARLATFPDAVRQRLINWQEGQSEWFSDTLLEVVSEFIAFDDAARQGAVK